MVGEIDWTDERVVAAEVGRFDVGLAPLRDPRGASLKSLQYLAAGVVPLVEAGGEAEHHVRDSLGEEAPIVSRGDREGVAAALKTLSDPALRRRLAERGRLAAERLYSRSVVADRLDSILRESLSGGDSARPGRR